MVEIVVIVLAAFLASGLTLFSGFGLGTLLMPVVALFFPVDIAVGITAMVHFANNIFKLGLVGMRADKVVVLRFGIPAILAAFGGALVLTWLTSLPPLVEYPFLGQVRHVLPLKFIVGGLIITFAVLELSPSFSAIALGRNLLPVGGCISGFFGGLSGHQGAFRSMFLIKAGLSKQEYIATGVVLAVMIDLSRLLVYGWDLSISREAVDWHLVVVATLAAFVGAFVGARLIKKMTIRSIRIIVSGLLLVVGAGLMAGIL